MSATENTINKNNKKPTRRLLAVILVLIAANIAGWFFYGQIDLTKDKRYTITDATTHMLKNMDGKMEVLVFLTGNDLPAAFKSLSKSTESMLQHFREISDNKISYRVIDPLGSDTATLNLLKQFQMTGIPAVSESKGGSKQTMVFPWALIMKVDDQGKSVGYPVFLPSINSMRLNRTSLLKSEILLEYNLANGIHQLSKKERAAIAYMTGNGEQFDNHIGAMFNALLQSYNFDTLNLDQVNIIPNKVKSIIIQNPTQPFTEQQKFKLDQYVMNGGHILWSLNTVTGNLDSLRSGRFNAMPMDLNLNDLLFNYGVRINTNVMEDAVDHAYIPLQARTSNSESSMVPWVYFPVLHGGSEHPIVKNLTGVLTRFVSSIDTVGNGSNIQKTILLSSSRESKSEAAPLPIILESALEVLNPADYRGGPFAGAVLLEGNFNSAFSSHRSVELTDWINNMKLPLKDQSGPKGRMIVLSDADIMTNEYNEKMGPSDMGIFKYDPGTQYDNKTFLLNCMEYMNDDENLLEARNKNFDNRILDPKVVQDEETKWQFINIAIPVIAILIFGSVFTFIRKKRYA